MTNLDDLAETMALLARPGLTVEVEDDHLLIKLLNRSHPSTELIVFRVTPVDETWPSHFADLVKSFDEFNDVATALVDRAEEWDVAMAIAQNIYNKGVLLNSHDWYDVLEFEYVSIEEDMSKWRR